MNPVPESRNKQLFNSHLTYLYLLAVILLGIIFYFEWAVGLLMSFFVIASFYYSVRKEKMLYNETETYITNLSHRLEKVGKEVLLEMPIGIILYNDDYEVEWSNSYMNQFGTDNKLIGASLDVLSEKLIPLINEDKQEALFELEGYSFETTINKQENLLYVFDRTAETKIQTLYYNDQSIIAIIYLDNYDEITQNMEDTRKSQLNSNVTAALNKWSHHFGLYLKRTSQDQFIAVGTKEILDELEQRKFALLDEMRELDTEQEQKNPVTLSIGIGVGNMPLPALGELAQSSLDLALGRGGDQVAIKDDSGKTRFYGGKTNPMEKRTRVRARVISHALRDLVKASDKVIIMGHKSPDMDSLGAAIGVLNIAKSNNIDGYIVFDQDDINTGVHRIVQAIKENEVIWKHFISPDDAEEVVTTKSLIVVVDTHKPSLTANERLLDKTEHKVVIDHHRRGEEFINNPTLVYMEPYASSTAELVTELLEYQPKNLKLEILEATALLAGIIVDTKGFSLRTGSRTFDAASYLRSKGADTVLVQKFMKEDLDIYVRRSNLVEKAEIYRDTIAISTANDGEVFDHVLIAQTADTLLTLTDINASFVISNREDGRIGISARSLGEINVQVIMEKMDGGGHLTNAAAQIADTTTNAVRNRLIEILDKYFEGRNS